jgi:Protein of unknown function (DUF1161)
MLKPAYFATLLILACTASYANNCDDLKAQIEGKIKAAGVANFTVTVADTAANAAGKVVGSCDKGAKKIMYLQSPATSAAPASTASASSAKPKPPAKASGGNAILTECKDGSSSIGGTCKK